MKIFLIRHGEQLYPDDSQGRKLVSDLDAPLVDLGRKQLHDLGLEFQRQRQSIDALYKSPVLRADDSGKILAETMGIQNSFIINDLREVDPCSAVGITYADLEKIGGDIYAHPYDQTQETLEHIVKRAGDAMHQILADSKNKGFSSIGIVSHGDTLSAFSWNLKHTELPSSYGEMRDSYYPQKAQAAEYLISDTEPFELVAEGRIITTEASQITVEGFRNQAGKKRES